MEKGAETDINALICDPDHQQALGEYRGARTTYQRQRIPGRSRDLEGRGEESGQN